MFRTIFCYAFAGVIGIAGASAQSAFSARGGAGSPAAIPPVTVIKPGAPSTTVPPASPLAPGLRSSTPEASTATVSRAVENAPRAQAVPNRVNVPPPAVPAQSSAGAIFRPGDTFQLRMTGMPYEDTLMYNLDFTIGGDGYVNVPLGGQVRAAGLTQSQLEGAIQKRLVEQKVFRWPTATINVPNVSRFVTVGGAVRAPGRQVWSADLTITSAIASAGGKGDFASDKINLIRSGEIRRYSLKKIKSRPAEDERLLPGDQVELL